MIAVPSIIDDAPEPIRAAAADLDEQRTRYLAAVHAVPEAERRHEELRRKRNAAAEAAARTGDALPADPAVAKAATAVTTARELAAAAKRNVARAEVKLAEAVAAHAHTWAEQIATERADLVARILEEAQQLDDDLGRLAELDALPQWLADACRKVEKRDYLGGPLPSMRTREAVLGEVDLGPGLRRLVGALDREEPTADAA